LHYDIEEYGFASFSHAAADRPILPHLALHFAHELFHFDTSRGRAHFEASSSLTPFHAEAISPATVSTLREPSKQHAIISIHDEW
jgi:hypothetical protein